MACPGSDTVGFSSFGMTVSVDGSNLCVSIVIGSPSYSQSYSFPLSNTDLSIANSIVQDIKSHLNSADQVTAAKRGFAIQDLIFKGLSLP
jgi:hypothetical protein